MLLPDRHSLRKTTAGSPNKNFTKQLKTRKNLSFGREIVRYALHDQVVAA
jgi:hypothetical protein